MRQAQAQRILVAAQDNAVLAAWASVVYDFNLPSTVEVSPYDAWEAYQELFDKGLVSSDAFDRTDVKQRFFTKQPDPHEIQEVLDKLPLLNAEEPQMPKMPANPFALTKPTAAEVAPHKAAPSKAMSPFAREVMPASKQPSALVNPMGNRAITSPVQMTGLPCTTPSENTLRPKMQCGRCGRHLDLVVDDAHAEVAKSDPTGSAGLLEVVWYSECKPCSLVYYCSVGQSDIRYGA